MSSDHLLRACAELTVHFGANVQEGQEVHIAALLAHAPLARDITEVAYEAGASFVHIDYRDPYEKLYRLRHAPVETLSFVPEWYDQQMAQLVERRAAFIQIAGNPEPHLFEGIDADRLRRCIFWTTPSQLRVAMSNESNWTIVACPNEGWAEQMLGEPDVARLWGLVAAATRLDQPDPVAAWEEHMTRLEERAAALNERSLDVLHFTGPGTDLRVGLLPEARWMAARFRTSWGRSYVPNLPTEEVFTAPDFRRTEGRVRCTKPLSLAGHVVEGLELTFERGRIVNVEAEANGAAIEAEIGRDEGAARLGEVALVDSSSAVGRTGMVFRDTLFDENAASHIAWGAAVEHVFAELPPEGQREDSGINVSGVHTDTMIGSPEVDVDATTRSGQSVAVIRQGDWVL
ncbi:MAG: aminopeptidase [Actinomycetota bacterium]